MALLTASPRSGHEKSQVFKRSVLTGSSNTQENRRKMLFENPTNISSEIYKPLKIVLGRKKIGDSTMIIRPRTARVHRLVLCGLALWAAWTAPLLKSPSSSSSCSPTPSHTGFTLNSQRVTNETSPVNVSTRGRWRLQRKKIQFTVFVDSNEENNKSTFKLWLNSQCYRKNGIWQKELYPT